MSADSAAGVVASLANLTLRNGFAGRGGGGSLRGVTRSGNSAVRGGAIAHEAGLLTLTNVTITANVASAEGAGILSDVSGDMTLTHGTIAGNQGPRGAALARARGGAMRLRNVLLSNSGEQGNCYLAGSDAARPISDGFNLATDATCFLTLPSDFPDTEARVLLPAGDHGGAAQTILLAADSGPDADGLVAVSDLIRAVNNTLLGCPE